MIVVSDAGPLMALAKTGGLDALFRLFPNILTPPAVYRELITEGLRLGAPDAFLLDARYRSQELSVTSPANALLPRPALLGRGEEQSILLAIERQAAWLLMDDLSARRAAQANLEVAGVGTGLKGTLGIILSACQQGHLSKEDAVGLLGAIRRRQASLESNTVAAFSGHRLSIRRDASSLKKSSTSFERLSLISRVSTSRAKPADVLRPGQRPSLTEARAMVGRFVEHYNAVRLHSALGYSALLDFSPARLRRSGLRATASSKRRAAAATSPTATTRRMRTPELVSGALLFSLRYPDLGEGDWARQAHPGYAKHIFWLYLKQPQGITKAIDLFTENGGVRWCGRKTNDAGAIIQIRGEQKPECISACN